MTIQAERVPASLAPEIVERNGIMYPLYSDFFTPVPGEDLPLHEENLNQMLRRIGGIGSAFIGSATIETEDGSNATEVRWDAFYRNPEFTETELDRFFRVLTVQNPHFYSRWAVASLDVLELKPKVNEKGDRICYTQDEISAHKGFADQIARAARLTNLPAMPGFRY